MKHVSSGKEQTLTSAFRAKRRFLSLMMQEKESINTSIHKRMGYKSQKNERKSDSTSSGAKEQNIKFEKDIKFDQNQSEQKI